MKIAFSFFHLFACFECALKVLGFHQGNEREAKPNWDNYANSIEKKFHPEKQEVKDAIRYLKEKPPKKQMIKNNKLCWEEGSTDPNELKNLFLCIRRVRNNLFHGGKFKGIYFEHPERSETLIKHCISILQYCHEISPDIRDEIEEDKKIENA